MKLMYKMLKKSRGDIKSTIKIPFIETLNGIFEGNNILEGFRSNTEILCQDINNDDDDDGNNCDFYKMCVKDNEIIFQLTENEMKIPKMTLDNLKHILF